MKNGPRTVLLVLALASADLAWAATDAPRGSVVLWAGGDQWVRIERQDDPTASPNDHPATLGTAAVASALGALRIRPADTAAGGEGERPVFAREELSNLAPRIAAGLAQAGPRQDVTFSTVGSHAVSGGLIKDPSVNSGRVFYEDGKLNVIFGELQANYRKRNVYGQRDQDFDPRRPGMRSKSSKQKWAFATIPGIALHANGRGDVRSDWVTIDPAVAPAQAAAVPARTQQPQQQPQPSLPPPAAAAPAPAPAPAAATPPGSKATTDLERRLQTLKDLRQKGLISEEAYDARVRELLSEL